MFSEYGEVSDCYIPRDHSTGQSRGFGFVRYSDGEPACMRWPRAAEQRPGEQQRPSGAAPRRSSSGSRRSSRSGGCGAERG